MSHPKWQIFLHTGDEHNKFWKVAQDPDDPTTMLVHNGRLGTQGQHQKPKKHVNEYSCRATIEDKVREKRNGGYQKVDQREFDRKSMEAAIVGSANKCLKMMWVKPADSSGGFVAVSDDALADPEYDPLLLVHVETKKEYLGDTLLALLFYPEGVDLLHNGRQTIQAGHPLYELTGKLKQAISLSMR